MKQFVMLLFAALFIVACKNTTKEPQAPASQINEVTITGDRTIDIDRSTIYWKGYKLLGNHTGKIKLKSADVAFQNGDITGGNFVVDMTSVVVTELMQDDDDEEEEDESPEDDMSDLAQHLMAPDFFDAKSHPEAVFVIKNSVRNGNTYTVTGDMTIKGITKEVTCDATLNDDGLTSEITINRTDFGVKYGSGSFFENLGDNVIKDNFDLIVTLKLTK